jgi:hypothetical protein
VDGGEEAEFVSAGVEHRHGAFAAHCHRVGGRISSADVGEASPLRRMNGLAPAGQPGSGLRVAQAGLP